MSQSKLTSMQPDCDYSDGLNVPAQIMVIDRANGPASILMDTVSRLMDCAVSVLATDNHKDAANVLSSSGVDLIVVGVEESRPDQVALLPYIRAQNPDLTMIAVGQGLPAQYLERLLHYGASEVLDIPIRSSELKQLVSYIVNRYLTK